LQQTYPKFSFTGAGASKNPAWGRVERCF